MIDHITFGVSNFVRSRLLPHSGLKAARPAAGASKVPVRIRSRYRTAPPPRGSSRAPRLTGRAYGTLGRA